VIFLKEYLCSQITHHMHVATEIVKWEQKGWKLHTYNSAGTAGEVKHYLLFEKEQ